MNSKRSSSVTSERVNANLTTRCAETALKYTTATINPTVSSENSSDLNIRRVGGVQPARAIPASVITRVSLIFRGAPVRVSRSEVVVGELSLPGKRPCRHGSVLHFLVQLTHTMASQHWSDAKKGVPTRAFGPAAAGQNVSPPSAPAVSKGSAMVKNSKPYPELRPGGALARQVKAQTHVQAMQHEHRAAQPAPTPVQAARNATLDRLRTKFNERARDTGRER